MQRPKTRQHQFDEDDLLGPLHPGEILRENVLPSLKLSKKALARQLRTSLSTVVQLLNEERRISASMAQKLAACVGPNAMYWLVLQARYDVWQAERYCEDDDLRHPPKRRASRNTPKKKQAKSRPAYSGYFGGRIPA